MMSCDRCHVRPAAVHVRDQTHGPHSVLNLCTACATRSLGEGLAGAEVAKLIGDLVARLCPGMANADTPAATTTDPARCCARCGLTAGEFARLGRLGCPDCYEALAAEVGPVLLARHRGVEHTGRRAPAPAAPAAAMPTAGLAEKEMLRLELEQAVAEEAFERAAKIRDALRRLH